MRRVVARPFVPQRQSILPKAALPDPLADLFDGPPGGDLASAPGYPVVFNLALRPRGSPYAYAGTDPNSPPNRNLNDSCGYPAAVTPQDCLALADRFGLAQRTVGVYAREGWQTDPVVYERSSPGQDSGFEQDVRRLARKLGLWSYLADLEEKAGYGEYGLLLFGFDDGLDLATPVANLVSTPAARRGRPPEAPAPQSEDDLLAVNYLRVFTQVDTRVDAVVTDRRSPRVGLPEFYSLRFAAPVTNQDQVGAAAPKDEWVKVHWSRVLHYADGPPGTPYHRLRLKGSYNHHLDLRKTLGGSAEMFWKGGFPGLALESHPQNQNPRVNIAEVREEMDEYYNNLKRWLALKNLTVKTLNPTIADPASHVQQHLTMIAADRAVPLNVLLGVTTGVAAGQQTSKDWKGRVSAHRTRQVTPGLVDPCIDRLVRAGAVRRPATGGHEVGWTDPRTEADADRAQVAVRLSQAVLQYVSGGGETVMPVDHFLSYVMGMDDALAKEVIAAARAQGDAALLTKDMWKPKAGQQTSPTGQAADRSGAAGSNNGTARRPRAR